MPSSKKKNSKKKVLKGGRSCPVGSQKVCISKGELVKLLKRAAIKKQKTRKKGKKVPKANKVVAEKKTKTVYESIFGSKEETEKPKTVEEKPKTEIEIPKTEKLETDIEEPKVSEETTITKVTEEPTSVETSVTEEPSVEPSTSVETQPKKETSFLGSIFGSNDKTATPVAK
jgi:hypothetical protein